MVGHSDVLRYDTTTEYDESTGRPKSTTTGSSDNVGIIHAVGSPSVHLHERLDRVIPVLDGEREEWRRGGFSMTPYMQFTSGIDRWAVRHARRHYGGTSGKTQKHVVWADNVYLFSISAEEMAHKKNLGGLAAPTAQKGAIIIGVLRSHFLVRHTDRHLSNTSCPIFLRLGKHMEQIHGGVEVDGRKKRITRVTSGGARTEHTSWPLKTKWNGRTSSL